MIRLTVNFPAIAPGTPGWCHVPAALIRITKRVKVSALTILCDASDAAPHPSLAHQLHHFLSRQDVIGRADAHGRLRSGTDAVGGPLYTAAVGRFRRLRADGRGRRLVRKELFSRIIHR
jgi:hypothetical protein